MPSFSQGDIVRVPFPYTDRATTSHRPALVISDGGLGQDGFLLWVAMITSQGNRGWPQDVPITDTRDATGLPFPSRVRPLKITTIEAKVASRIGCVGADTLGEVMAVLRTNLKLDQAPNDTATPRFLK